MDRTVDRRTARVDPDDVAERLERTGLARQRVVEPDRHAIGLQQRDRERGDRPTRHPRRRTGCPVEALTLTAAASTPRSAAIGGAHRVEVARPGAAAPRRSSGRRSPTRPAGRGHAAHDLGEHLARGDPLRRRRVRPGTADRGRRAGGAEQRVADRVERDVAVRVAVEPRRAARWRCRRGRAALPGPKGWPSCPIPTRGARGPARAASTRRRSAGCVTLRLLGSPGTTWTGILQASSSAASSVHVSGPSGGNRAYAARKQAAPDALRRLRGAERLAVDGRPDDRPVDALDGLGDRQDRDRGAVWPRSRR